MIRRGSDLVKGTLSRFASQDLDALRTLGTIEVELSFGGDVHRGPAKELAWS